MYASLAGMGRAANDDFCVFVDIIEEIISQRSTFYPVMRILANDMKFHEDVRPSCATSVPCSNLHVHLGQFDRVF